MTEEYRGGNSRLLARALDQMGNPLAILDRRGAILFVNAAMCRLVKAEATQLVGQQSSWQIAADDRPLGALLTALAPPAGAMQGRVVARQLVAPVVFGSPHTGQLFVPLADGAGGADATLVMLGQWEAIQDQLPPLEPTPGGRRRTAESILVQIRGRWQSLDSLHALVGTSPAAGLAMQRSQLAVAHQGSVWLAGPRGSGKSEVVKGIFLGRLKKCGLNKLAGHHFPVSCSLVHGELLQGMLDVFASRLRPDVSAAGQLLVLEQPEELTSAGVETLHGWLEQHGGTCTLAATSHMRAEELALRGPEWHALIARLAAVEIVLPPLAARREDIPVLAVQMLAAVCEQKGRAPLALSQEAVELLMAYPWPENVAELARAMEEAVRHAVLVASIQVPHLPVAIRTYASTLQPASSAELPSVDLDQILLEVERTLLQRALKLSPRNRAQAARWLGVSRARLLRRIEQLGLEKP